MIRAALLLLLQGAAPPRAPELLPPAQSPFRPVEAMVELGQVLDWMWRDAGIPHVESLAMIAWGLQLPNWKLADGVGPLLDRWP